MIWRETSEFTNISCLSAIINIVIFDQISQQAICGLTQTEYDDGFSEPWVHGTRVPFLTVIIVSQVSNDSVGNYQLLTNYLLCVWPLNVGCLYTIYLFIKLHISKYIQQESAHCFRTVINSQHCMDLSTGSSATATIRFVSSAMLDCSNKRKNRLISLRPENWKDSRLWTG